MMELQSPAADSFPRNNQPGISSLAKMTMDGQQTWEATPATP